MFFSGVDIGSAMTKVVVTDEFRVLASVTRHTDAEHRRMANKVMEEALANASSMTLLAMRRCSASVWRVTLARILDSSVTTTLVMAEPMSTPEKNTKGS